MKTNLSENIMTAQQMQQKIKRIAFQILEDHLDEKEIVIVGIEKSGFILAQELFALLKSFTTIPITIGSISVNKKNPIDEITCTLQAEEYMNRAVIIVDDVLNSGATLIYAAKHFLNTPLKQLKTAVLIDRSHKTYPIKANYKGMSLSTSLQETVQVRFGKNACVVLK